MGELRGKKENYFIIDRNNCQYFYVIFQEGSLMDSDTIRRNADKILYDCGLLDMLRYAPRGR